MSVLLFPGQGSQFVGMGKDLFDNHENSRKWFQQADDILGFGLSKIMFEGDEEDLKKTSVTQPAVFLYAYVSFKMNEDKVNMSAVAGHSLGEFTSLIANGVLSFEDGLQLVYKRAMAMQEACNTTKGTMAAILGLEDGKVEELCELNSGIVVAANYNCPGQLVISGEINAVNELVESAKAAGAKRAVVLNVDGAFHSPLMGSAQESLSAAIMDTKFNNPTVPVYQNVSAKAETNPDIIKQNLITQLTSSVRWTQSMKSMVDDGHTHFAEFGGKVLSGFIKRYDRALETVAY